MAKVAFKQCDIERAFKAAQAVGYTHPTVDILPDGRIRVLTDPSAVPKAPAAPESALEAWERANGLSDA